MIAIALFKNSDIDKQHRGQVEVTIIRQLTHDEATAQRETGPMFVVKLKDGTQEHAFLDELVILMGAINDN